MRVANHISWAFVLFIMLSIGACRSPITITNKEQAPGFSLASYQTFGFYDEQAGNENKNTAYSEYVALLKREVRKHLEVKGLRYESQKPDLLVNFGISVAEKTQTRETDFRQDAPYYTGQRRYTWRSQEVVVGHYKEGSVEVDLVDRALNELVWTAEATAIIPKDNEKLEERIVEGVAKMFEVPDKN